jgi:hypothetical protein
LVSDIYITSFSTYLYALAIVFFWISSGLAWTGPTWPTCFDGEYSGFVPAGDKYLIQVDVVDSGVAQKSPTSLASLYRVSAGCLIIIDLDLFLGAVYREIGW